MEEELEKNISNAIFYKDCYSYLVRIKTAKDKVPEYKKILNEKKRLIEFNEIIYNPVLIYLSMVSLELKLKSLIKEKNLTKTHTIQTLFLKIEKSIQIKIYESVKNKYKKLDIEKCNEKYLKCEHFTKLSDIKYYQLNENFSFEEFLNYLNSNFPKKLFSKGRNGDYNQILLIENNILNSILMFNIQSNNNNINNKFFNLEFMPFYTSYKILNSILTGYEIPEMEILILNNLEIFHVINSLYYYSLELIFIYILKINGINEYSKQPHNVRELFNLIPIEISKDLLDYLTIKSSNNNIILSDNILQEFNYMLDAKFQSIIDHPKKFIVKPMNKHKYKNKLILRNYIMKDYYIFIISDHRIAQFHLLQDFCKGKNIKESFLKLILHEYDPYVQYRYINENKTKIEHHWHFPDVQLAFITYILEYIKEKYNPEFLKNHKI